MYEMSRVGDGDKRGQSFYDVRHKVGSKGSADKGTNSMNNAMLGFLKLNDTTMNVRGSAVQVNTRPTQ